MWRPWGKSTVKIHETYSPKKSVASSSPSFSCSSFKDIQTLCTDDSSPFSSSSPKYPNRVFHRVRSVSSVHRSWPNRPSNKNQLLPANSDPAALRLNPEPDSQKLKLESTDSHKPKPESDVRISIPGAENSVVVYLTSLRVVRSTFEECKDVRSILRGFRVRIDERDLSMDASFASELQRIFEDQSEAKVLKLPRVFIGGRYVGGAEEVKQLNEIGELKKMMKALPEVEAGECEICGGHGFVPCNVCNGSHKRYTEKLGFRSCTSCNENGLIRCPSCSSPL